MRAVEVPDDGSRTPLGSVPRSNIGSGSGVSPPDTNTSDHKPSRTIAATIRTCRSAAVLENSLS